MGKNWEMVKTRGIKKGEKQSMNAKIKSVEFHRDLRKIPGSKTPTIEGINCATITIEVAGVNPRIVEFSNELESFVSELVEKYRNEDKQ